MSAVVCGKMRGETAGLCDGLCCALDMLKLLMPCSSWYTSPDSSARSMGELEIWSTGSEKVSWPAMEGEWPPMEEASEYSEAVLRCPWYWGLVHSWPGSRASWGPSETWREWLRGAGRTGGR